MNSREPRIVVFSSLFPNPAQPNAGIFIRERMFRVGETLPLKVVAPLPWFPFQRLIRIWKPHFRPDMPASEVQAGVEVFHPRFFSVPGIFKSLDGLFMALGSLPTLWRLKREFDFQIIDAHFAYPDGYAATLLGKWFKVPVTITLRGTEARLCRNPVSRRLIFNALSQATRVFSVADSLKRTAIDIGVPEDKIRVVGNGVDTHKFQPLPKDLARKQLDLRTSGHILVSVGGLCERKGFHRVIECLPDLKKAFPNLRYLVVGGASAEGDWSDRLKRQVAELGLSETVHFLGPMPSDRIKIPLSAGDIFVLATRNEGWANVFLEAMACGLPVVTTDVGGNREVVCKDELGKIVPFDDCKALTEAMLEALYTVWEREKITQHAQSNSWDQRVAILINEFQKVVALEEGKAGVSNAATEG
ncbi:glycosyltransferase [Nitrosospira multiformis]|uniref:Glycosyltransferase involved in cell wall bisynthesis n=1 Tax=Nitrosospira multiformis TaxID=1231 RepID=A0A1I7GD44_9PROT|nr:glycosyltransferase [Nitrosospira multiformis]SFU46343.1 Glycosyltransferase involved in cell wall bisynthesis [Nitrosospira multiformis]